MLASSILSNYILTLPTVFIEFVLARRMFHMQDWGNLWGVFLLVTLGIVTFAALGLIIASVTNTHAGDPGHQPAPLVGFPVPFRRHAPPAHAAGLDPALRAVPAGHLSGDRPRTRDWSPAWASCRSAPELIALAVSAAIAFVVSQQLFRWEPEAKVAPQRQALGRRRHHSLPAARHLGIRARRPAQRRPHRFPIHRAPLAHQHRTPAVTVAFDLRGAVAHLS